MGKVAGQFFPQLPHLKVEMPSDDVVHQHDTARAYLRKPRVEVVSYGIVGVQPIDVQQVDALVAEVFNSLVERCPEELRKGGVELLVLSR
jgi:hypothetical protein